MARNARAGTTNGEERIGTCLDLGARRRRRALWTQPVLPRVVSRTADAMGTKIRRPIIISGPLREQHFALWGSAARAVGGPVVHIGRQIFVPTVPAACETMRRRTSMCGAQQA